MNVTDDDVVDAFAALLETCRAPFSSTAAPARAARSSGRRRWPRGSAWRRRWSTVANAGYDLEPLREHLEEREGQGREASVLASDAEPPALQPQG